MKVLKGVTLSRKMLARIFYVLTAYLSATAICSAQTVEDYSALPPLLSENATPLVMLALSNDHQLWIKAYTDYTDLDGDGNLDTYYNDNFDYYGYFNSDFCYTYAATGVGGGAGFYPNGRVTGGHKCTTAAGNWSGNFLNWATMTRMDVVRKVLYGGLRVLDTASTSSAQSDRGITVLQRAFIPADNHAFVKIVDQSEINGNISDYTPISGQSVISLCSVTDYASGASDISKDMSITTNPPLMKVASGNWFAWSGSERNQCQFTDEGGGTSNPGGNSDFSPVRGDITNIGSGSTQDELQVRVQVCRAGEDEDDCRLYQDAAGVPTYKPAGLLQAHGEVGDVKFGLITGSYNEKIGGGVLRKNISFLGNGAGSTEAEIDMASGVFVNQTTSDDGIVNTLNRIRIQGWDYSATNYYDCNTYGIPISTFKTSTANNRQCRDWGNPISELYLEALRYFAGQTTATTAFNANDSTIITGLDQVSWADPMSTDEFCANCSIVLLSTGLNMFDGDNLGSASDLPNLTGASDVVSMTNLVGTREGITSGSYIVGNETGGGGTAGTCDSKTISGLGEVDGLCPEMPQLEGTYHVAGLAHYAHSQDLRTSSSYPENQTVDTFAVSLAESLPSFEITTTNDNTVSFVPGCRAHTNGSATLADSGWTDCSLVDLTVAERQLTTVGLDTFEYGKLVISWEDSYWGNDYDMDGYSVIEYCTATGDAATVQTYCPDHTNDERSGYAKPDWGAASTGEIQLRVSNIGAAAGNALRFGYVMNGSVANDGTYIDLLRPGGVNFNSVALTGTATNAVLWGPTVHKFMAASGTPTLLKNPLWYAAKYGNFTDYDSDNIPDDSPNEWDALDLNGNSGSDGIPDAYFPVSNPAQLETRLNDVFSRIRTKVAAGNAAAVIANSGAGEGGLFQAVYRPRYLDITTGDSVSWVGLLNAFFIDDDGRLRQEGGTPNATLDSSDPVVSIFFDPADEKTKFQLYTTGGMAIGSPQELDQLNPIWSGHKELAKVTTYTAQRSYSDLANTGRHIFTSIGGSEIDFTASSFDKLGGDEFRYLGFDSTATQAEIDNLVNYIRGEEIASNQFRPRTIDFDSAYDRNGDGTEPWLLGDIVHSSPIALAAPSESYDITYRDFTYRTFKQKYRNRRQVVYVGANDGMLHAFNAGFYDPTDKQYDTSITYDDPFTGSTVTTVAHPLGSELWGYVPNNLLPHLQWLKNPTYQHVFYVDGVVQSYDVNIFDFDSANPTAGTHPYGWGTILVVGFRLGGGDYSLDTDGDTVDDTTARSAYVILDVTDPEQPPTLLAEITDDQLGFTTGEPTVVKFREPDDSGAFVTPNTNEWFLVFGSGPAGTSTTEKANALLNAESSQNAQLYSLNLKTLILNQTDTSEASSFIGGITPADWDRDFSDDVIYFGTIADTAAAPTGRLMRGILSQSSGNLTIGLTRKYLLSDTDQPFSARPVTVRDRQGASWIFAGTGRFYVAADNLSSYSPRQTYYGVKEPIATGVTPPQFSYAVSSPTPDAVVTPSSEMVETTDIRVFTDGTVTDQSGNPPVLSPNTVTVTTFQAVRREVANVSGWYFDFITDASRNTTNAALANNSLVFTEYRPSGLQCEPEGESYLNAPDFQTGLPSPFAPLGTNPLVTNNGEELVLMGALIGTGSASAPQIVTTSDGDKIAIVQLSTGEISGTNVGSGLSQGKRQSWREIPITW